MKLVSRYVPLALGWPFQLLGVTIISLIVWGQAGFELDKIRLLFIVTNYLCWLVILPWINGWVINESGAIKVVRLTQLLVILSAHWLASNVFFYLMRSAFLDYRLLPSIIEISGYLIPSIISRAIDLTLFVGVLTWIFQSNQLQDQKLEVSQKEAELQRSKLQSLKNQLNPHFLFNSMHNIASLIGQDNDSAHDLTIKVSGLLRKIMVINELEEHSLKSEWDFVQDYLAIEMERFQDRLKLDVSFDEKLNNLIVPTLILQPLVENAFKHGIAHAVALTVLEISVERSNNHVVVRVINDTFPTTPSNSNHVGLVNLKERLNTYYQGKAELLTQAMDGRYEATLKLPVDS